MAEAPLSFVGREHEMRLLREAVAEACAGSGGLWFLSGEPGIGKSRLAEEAAALGREEGMRVFWGRCWEAGGAPAYWPWIQVLRALLRTAPTGLHDAHNSALAQILPEAAGGDASDDRGLGAEQARFRLMDAIGAVLSETAEQWPLLIVLEDIHVADESSIVLLEFLATLVRNHALLLVATFRPVEARSGPHGGRLVRTVQQGNHLPLERLSPEAVAAFAKTGDSALNDDQARVLNATTEGHPLFMVEVARLWRSPTSGAGNEPPVPDTVRAAIEERLAKLSISCRETVSWGSIVGREFEVGLLRDAFETPEDRMENDVGEALEAAVLVDVAPRRFRFSHFMIREVLYDALSREARITAHQNVANALETASNPDGEPRWSEIAHHLRAVGDSGATAAARAYRRAGAQALKQLAFGDAAQAYAKARERWSVAPTVDEAETIELMVELGHAQIRSGGVAEGKETCFQAADRARVLGASELFAHAALEHGAALLFAQVDDRLVALLQESLEMLEATDSALRARVAARLAAAQQPALDPEGPFEMARQAIAMARRVGDPEALLDTFRTGGSAFVDLGDPMERLKLDEEHVALAKHLRNPVEALRGTIRVLLDYWELGRLEDASRATRAAEKLAEELGHGFYQWRSTALQAAGCLWRGDLSAAEQRIERARALGEEGGDLNSIPVWGLQRLRLLRIRGEFDEQLPVIESLEQEWQEWGIGGTLMNAVLGAEHVLAGRREAGVRRYQASAIDVSLKVRDRTLQFALADLSIAASDRAGAEQLYAGVLEYAGRLSTGGALFMTIDAPMSAALARLAAFLDKRDEARGHYEDAIEVARRTGGRPVLGILQTEYAELLARSESETDRSKAKALVDEALAIADEVGMPEVRGRATHAFEVDERPAAPSMTSTSSDSLSMESVGESWLVRWGGESFHLKDTKGVRMLARLVAEPGREFHVLELAGAPEVEGEVIDRGDAGEMIDEEARREYKRRASELREEVEEAQQWNDPGRADKARAELEFLTQELSRAVGLGGRERRAGAAAERARVNVQRRIRDAIRRIDTQHPRLAKQLENAVRTGTFCAYEPA